MDANELDELYMREALAEARRAAEAGEVPIGAVVVHDGAVIARAHNMRELHEDPSAHAEFSAMLDAARALGRWRLTGCTVYVTLEPCLMCAGLMVNARVDRCVYGAADPKGGALGTLYDVSCDDRLNHAFSVTSGVLADECGDVLRSFFAGLRAQGKGADVPQEAAAPKVERRPSAAPKVLLAIDSFKDCATSAEIECWVEQGVRRACPAARVSRLPVADGGEGTLEAIGSALGGHIVERAVVGPLERLVGARYLLAGPVAAIEMAEAAGIEYSPRTHEAAMRATTRGVGELLADAVAQGVKTVYFAIGGSATSDGGAGFLQALGARLLDGEGREVDPGLAGLEHLAFIDLAPALELLGDTELVVLSDVDNPLVGRRGALRVFGPQKGLRPDACADFDAWMVAYGRALDEARERAGLRAAGGPQEGRRPASVLGVPGGGAAGGLGAALFALGARMASGSDTVLDLVGFDEALEGVSLVITGEGVVDRQTAGGKCPVGVARRAKRRHVPVIALAGGRADDLDAVYRAGIDLVVPIVRKPMTLVRALAREEARANLVCAGEQAMRAFMLGRRPGM